MDLAFRCPHCGSVIRTQYLSPGEPALCRNCGQSAPAPAESDPDVVDLPPVPSSEAAQDLPAGAGGVSQTTSWLGYADGSQAGPPPIPDQYGDPASSGWHQAPQFSVSRVLSVMFRESLAGAIPYGLISLVSLLPVFLTGGLASDGTDFGIETVGQLVSNLMSPLTTAAIIAATYERLQGKKRDWGVVVQTALRRWLPLVVINILVTILISLGFLLLFVPGIFAAIAFAVVGPSCIVEDKGIGDSMSRSSELATGFRWRVLGYQCAYLLLVGLIIVIPLVLVFSAFTEESGVGSIAQSVVISAISVIVEVTSAVGATALYRELRVAQGEFDQSELLSVFE